MESRLHARPDEHFWYTEMADCLEELKTRRRNASYQAKNERGRDAALGLCRHGDGIVCASRFHSLVWITTIKLED